METCPPEATPAEAERHVTALYQAHALGLARLALLVLGDSAAAPAYLRTSVLNGCRTLLKQRSRASFTAAEEPLESAEAAAIHTEEQRSVLAAVRRLPARQREALVLRYYLDMTEEQAAQAMGVSRGTVKSATSRAVAAVGRMLKEES